METLKDRSHAPLPGSRRPTTRPMASRTGLSPGFSHCLDRIPTPGMVGTRSTEEEANPLHYIPPLTTKSPTASLLLLTRRKD